MLLSVTCMCMHVYVCTHHMYMVYVAYITSDVTRCNYANKCYLSMKAPVWKKTPPQHWKNELKIT